MAKDKDDAKAKAAQMHRDAVKAAHAARESAEEHDRGVAERLKKAIQDEAEKN